MQTFKRVGLISLLGLLSFCCVGCGKVATTKDLLKYAKQTYGACKLVSKSESEESNTIVVHDKLQDFDYEVSSRIVDFAVDGSTFFTYPSTQDTFYSSLSTKIVQEQQDTISEYCDKYMAEYKEGYPEMKSLGCFNVYSKGEGEVIALDVATILQTYNKKNRLDGWTISVYNIADTTEKFGAVTLPDIKWVSYDEEVINFYVDAIHRQIGEDAEYIRADQGFFEETDADIHKVAAFMGTDYPTENKSVVMFYWFRKDNQMYYLCDFQYKFNDEDANQTVWYTNYPGGMHY